MGIYMTKEQDPELYKAAFEEAQRLLTISEEIRVSVKKVNQEPIEKIDKKVIENKPSNNTKTTKSKGYCIRTGVKIPFNVEKPLSYDAYKEWNKYGDPDFPEKFCHFSGEPSNGETSVNKPIMKKNWKKAKEIHGL
jgi:hypothetical protein